MARKKTTTKAAPPATTTAGTCACGCGTSTKGGEFAIGHDARHKSNLISRVVNAKDGRSADARTARAELDRRGWSKFLVRKQEILAAKTARATKDEASSRDRGGTLAGGWGRGISPGARASPLAPG